MEYITKHYNLKDIDSKLAEDVAKEYNLDPNQVQLIRKGLLPEDVMFQEGERASIDYITSDSVDRDGDSISMDGLDTSLYLKHPVVMFAHNYKELPIGRAAWVKRVDNKLVAKTIYATKEANPFAEQVWQYKKSGMPLAKSLGFIPLEFKDYDPKMTGGMRRKYSKSLLLEYSDVPIPSNPDAMNLAISKGLLTVDQAKEYDPTFVEIKEPEIVLELVDQNEDEYSTAKGAIPYHKYPLSDKGSWDAGAEKKKATVDDLKKMCAWMDSSNPDSKGSYKLPHHLVEGYKTVKNGVVAAGNAISGARGGVSIPSSDLSAVKSHLAKHYKEFEMDAPWTKKEFGEYQLVITGLEEAGILDETKSQLESRKNELEKILFGEENIMEDTEEKTAVEDIEEKAKKKPDPKEDDKEDPKDEKKPPKKQDDEEDNVDEEDDPEDKDKKKKKPKPKPKQDDGEDDEEDLEDKKKKEIEEKAKEEDKKPKKPAEKDTRFKELKSEFTYQFKSPEGYSKTRRFKIKKDRPRVFGVFGLHK